MYDIIKDIWKNPGAAYSPMPMWVWNDAIDADTLTAQLDEFHKRGIDACVIRPCAGYGGEEYLSDGYFDVLEAVLEAAKKRFMLVSFCDVVCVAGIQPGLGVRRMYAKKMSETLAAEDEILFCVYIAFDGELMTDFRTEPADGYVGYYLVLGGESDCDGAFDVLDPSSTEGFISSTHERYYSRLAPYFGQTLTAFYSGSLPPLGRDSDNGVPWSRGMIEEFFECGGELEHLAALFFETKEKKVRREAEYIYSRALSLRLGRAYYAPISDWCMNHGIALMGYPQSRTDVSHLGYFTIPGRCLSTDSAEPTNEDSAVIKSAADAARHRGQSRSVSELFGGCRESGNPWHFTPDEMMTRLNHAFSCGSSLIVPHAFYLSDKNIPAGERDVGKYNIWWQDYRKIAGYIKRMAWLGSIGSNNPMAAVLCSDEYVPVRPTEPLYGMGYSFNYLSIDDFMTRAHIHDGKVRIDRYSYDIVLVDGRLRLNTEIVRRLGEFAVEGGMMYRGSDFIGFMDKHARRRTYLEGESGGKLRLLHYTKSGCPFFIMINAGEERIDGQLVTDISAKAEMFDPFTGKTEPIGTSLHESGFAYSVSVGAHEAKIIGMGPSSLPVIGETKKRELREITSLSEGKMKFDFCPVVGRHAVLSFLRLDEIADVTVNGRAAGRMIFKPYELDITNCLHIGENSVELVLTGSAANKYGTAVPAGFEGCTVRIYDNPDADGSAAGENDELWDILDEAGKPTGRTHRRGDEMKAGDYHLVIHIWVRNSAGEYLLTKRAPDKMFPLTWECTGGSALAGEDSLTAAIREVREETGLKLTPERGKVVIHSKHDNYFGDVWLFNEEFDLDLVRLQPGETVDKRKATETEIRELMRTGEFAPYDYIEDLFGAE